MKKSTRIAVVLLVVTAAVAVVAVKDGRRADEPAASAGADAIPRLVDLGSDKCTQCKMMAPILDDLREEYAGRLDVVFIDVYKTEGAAKRYGVSVIPTQIFYAVDGAELYRHVGFYSGQEILAKWRELGVEF
ncbi:thioredoxin family protein [bacterium]|nr:thioredoxin family protein [bacterium]MBU1073574.1 thioredoxin family protein [bacterium]MBU1674572.1 thioredoxin family protein [bacterium]